MDELHVNHSCSSLMRDSLERTLVFNEDVEDLKTHECIYRLNSVPPYIPRQPFESLDMSSSLSTRHCLSIELPPTLEMK